MKEVKTTLKRIAVYYLLLALNIIPCASLIPDVFPTRNLSTVYLLILSVCLVLYYAHRVSPAGGLSVMMKSLSWMGLLLILLRGIKYSAFSEVGVLARHVWYLYYVPMLLLPLFLFFISLMVAAGKSARGTWIRYAALAVTLAFISLVLTNDLHGQVFRFQPGFADWDSDYTHGWLFYAMMFWQYALYLAALLILIIKCRIVSSRKNSWVILIPAATGIALNVLILTGNMPRINGIPIMEFQEALIFSAATVLECCMQLGLIPTNRDYGKLFRQLSIAAEITDRKGTPVYVSASARPLTAEESALPDGARIDGHTVLHRMTIPGGFGFWQDDVTEIDRLNEELAEAKAELAEEVELVRLRNELKEKQAKIEQRTLVYDTVAKRTKKQSNRISRLARTAMRASDPAKKDDCRRRITLLGAYIKRFANLMLMSKESDRIVAGELGLSVSEVLRYLNYCGIPGEFFGGADRAVNADAALAVFEAFEALLEANDQSLKGVFANLSAKEHVTLKLTFEGLTEGLTDEMAGDLARAGVTAETQCEDNVTYLCFTLPEGGECA